MKNDALAGPENTDSAGAGVDGAQGAAAGAPATALPPLPAAKPGTLAAQPGAPAAKLKIKYLATDKLIPYARNARTHNAAQISAIAGSIREFGFTNPVLLGGESGILAGHGRVLAAQTLGMKRIPTIDLAHLTQSQQRAYMIADNQLATKAGWDDELLRLEMGNLKAAAFDIEITGFGAARIGKLLEGAGELDGMPTLPAGDKQPFQQMTFQLHDDQAAKVKAAIAAAKAAGRFVNTGNENSNGNALARICDAYLAAAAGAAAVE